MSDFGKTNKKLKKYVNQNETIKRDKKNLLHYICPPVQNLFSVGKVWCHVSNQYLLYDLIKH